MESLNQVVETNGCRIAYDIRGNGPPVLFIQGVGVQGDGWLPQITPLSATFKCMSFDNRGMNRSQLASTDLTVEQMAGDAKALMDAEGWDSAHVVGHSLGGLIALSLALAIPNRVRSLSLLCTFANGRAAAPLTFRMIWAGGRSRIGTRRMRRNGFLQLVMPLHLLKQKNKDELADQLSKLFGHDIADQPPIVNAQLQAMRKTDVSSRLGELVHIPTLVMCGRHDPIAPPSIMSSLTAGISGSRYVEYDDASHGLPIQWAGRVNSELAEHFLAADSKLI